MGVGLARIPIYGFGPSLLGFQRRRYMCIYPKRPKCVIQIEHHHLGKRQSVAEGIWSNTLLNHNARVGRFELFYRLFNHVRSQEQKSEKYQKRGYYERQSAGYSLCRCWEVISSHGICRFLCRQRFATRCRKDSPILMYGDVSGSVFFLALLRS